MQGLTFWVINEDDRNFNANLETCVEASVEKSLLYKKEHSAPSIQNEIINIL